MSKYFMSPWPQQRPSVQMAPLIDIVFLTLVFFLTLSVFTQMEAEIDISVPKSKTAKEAMRSPGKIIVNVTKDGKFIVNQNQLDEKGLEAMLRKVSTLFPDQPVIIRADEESYHKYVVKVLDACVKANIWDVSFAAAIEE